MKKYVLHSQPLAVKIEKVLIYIYIFVLLYNFLRTTDLLINKFSRNNTMYYEIEYKRKKSTSCFIFFYFKLRCFSVFTMKLVRIL